MLEQLLLMVIYSLLVIVGWQLLWWSY